MQHRQHRHDLKWAVILFVCMFMAVGPGVLLVNSSTMFAGIPAVYAWGLSWYFVFVAIAILLNQRTPSESNNTENSIQ